MSRNKVNSIKPFWDVIPSFFLFPLKAYGIIALITFSVLWTLSFSSVLQIIVIFAIAKYAMTILQTTAQGKLSAPALSFKVLNDNYELSFKQLFLFVFPVVILMIPDSAIAYIIAINIVAFYLLALPASVMTLAFTHSFFSAINPFVLGSLIKRLGWSYGILYAFLLLLNGGGTAAFYFVTDTVPSSLQIFFWLLFQTYFGFVMYAMMGYVLYQYHDEIGFDVEEDSSTEEDDKLDEFDQSIENEDYLSAKDILIELLKSDPDNLDLRRKFHKVIKILGDNKQLTYHGEVMISRLIAAKKADEAVNIYLDCISVDPAFKPELDTDYLPLAEAMRRMRQHKLALKLVNGFHKTYPNNPNIPYVYLLAVKIFIEDLSQDEQAKPLLSFLQQHYGDHEIKTELEAYQRFLSKV